LRGSGDWPESPGDPVGGGGGATGSFQLNWVALSGAGAPGRPIVISATVMVAELLANLKPGKVSAANGRAKSLQPAPWSWLNQRNISGTPKTLRSSGTVAGM